MTTTINYLPANETTYSSLQSFNSIDEMNVAVKHHKKSVSSPKHKNIYAVLDLISQYSCVYFGVSWLTINRISDLLGISYKTTQRALDRLVELNIIVKHACKRVDGDKRQTSNIYIIQPIKTVSDLPQVTDQKTPLLNSKNINNTDDTCEPVKKSDENNQSKKTTHSPDNNSAFKGLLNKLPVTIAHALQPFTDDIDELYSLAGTVFKGKAAISKSIRIEEHEQAYYNAIISILASVKLGKVRNLHGLIYHAVKRTTKTIVLRDSLSRLMF